MDVPTPPPMPQNTVVINGAAVNLITALIGQVKSDMQDVKDDLANTIETRLREHEIRHDRTGAEMTRVQQKIHDDIEALQEADRIIALAKARHDGQMWLFTTGVAVIDKYGRWILLAISFGLGVLAAAGVGIRFEVGS